MFSGIVQEMGKVIAIEDNKNMKTFTISFNGCKKCKIGDSVAINGTCLTVTDFNKDKSQATFDAVYETLQKTNLDKVSKNDNVNVELAIKYGDEIGGHMMQGHVDEEGQIINIDKKDNSVIIEFSTSKEFNNFLIKKGFVSIDGMSITIVDVLPKSFTVTLIPHTLSVTIAQNYKIGSFVNLEADATGKYIYKYLKGMGKNV